MALIIGLLIGIIASMIIGFFVLSGVCSKAGQKPIPVAPELDSF